MVPGTLCPAEWRPSSAGVPTPPCSPGLGVHTLVRFRTFLNLGEQWSEDVRELEQPSPAAMYQVQPRVYFRGRDAHTSGPWVGAASRLDTRTVVLGGGCWRSAAWKPECTRLCQHRSPGNEADEGGGNGRGARSGGPPAELTLAGRATGCGKDSGRGACPRSGPRHVRLRGLARYIRVPVRPRGLRREHDSCLTYLEALLRGLSVPTS